MTDATVIKGYILTHPHDPYEDVISIHINCFAGGDAPWQAQIYSGGSLVEADYFPSEADALRWAAREVTLIACVAKAEPEPVINSGCFALAIDNDDACELHLFASEAERAAHMWSYAFDNSGTDAETLDEFKAEHCDNLGSAMEATNNGWHIDEMTIGADRGGKIADALGKAESFIAGFEGDELQDGIADLLATIRAAKLLESAAPDMLAALRATYSALPGLPLGSDAACMVQAAIAKAEGRSNG